MEALDGRVKESCGAAVLDGAESVYVLRVPTRKIRKIALGEGARLPAYCTSLGRVLLAGMPDDDALRRLAAAPLDAHTRHTVTDPAALLAKVQQARRQGWAQVNQELEEGLVSIAAPITNRGGRVVAALNVSGQANRTSARQMQEKMLPPLLDAAQALSRLLGQA